MTDAVQQAILTLPEAAWSPAIETDGSARPGADVAELTGLLPHLTAAGWPAGMRVIVRRERPHPGAQLRFTDAGGWRFQTFATDTPAGWQHGQGGQIAQLEARHRAHARVEDRIRCAKTSGLNHPPSREFAINQVWLELTLIACDLLAWAQTTLLERRARQSRTAAAALQAAAHRRPDHPRPTPHVRPDRRRLALAARPGRRLHPTASPTAAGHLTGSQHIRPRPGPRRHRPTRRSLRPAHQHHTRSTRSDAGPRTRSNCY